MLEAMVQAAREVLAERGYYRMMLGEVRALRYGNFVRPGESLRVEVDLVKEEGNRFSFKGNGLRVGNGIGGRVRHGGVRSIYNAVCPAVVIFVGAPSNGGLVFESVEFRRFSRHIGASACRSVVMRLSPRFPRSLKRRWGLMPKT